jgi:hypothetical protein
VVPEVQFSNDIHRVKYESPGLNLEFWVRIEVNSVCAIMDCQHVDVESGFMIAILVGAFSVVGAKTAYS